MSKKMKIKITVFPSSGCRQDAFRSRLLSVSLFIKICTSGASLVAQWLRIHLPMQGKWVRALVREHPTCRRATKPVHYSY